MGCLLNDLRAFGISVDQWTTLAQDKWAWRKMALQGTERFIAKMIAAEKERVGVQYLVVCPIVKGRTKGRTVQSKRVRAGSLAIAD